MYKRLFVITISVVIGMCLSEATKGQSINKDSTYTIKINNMTLVVNAAIGARVISLKLEDQEILSGEKVHPEYYGSTLWLSPEGKWKGHGLLDNGAYKVDNFNEANLRLTSQRDSLRGFSFIKQFTTSPEDTAIIIRYTIKNILKDNQQVSPWEVTRVPTGGLAFYSYDSMAELSKSTLPHLDSIGMVWYPYDSSTVRAQKLFLFGSEGWQAYVHNGIAFIKQFSVLKHNEVAPGEENIELYVNKEKTYMELENQGAFTLLLPGDSLNYEVKWYARQLPANIKVCVSNQGLVNYVRGVLKLKK